MSNAQTIIDVFGNPANSLLEFADVTEWKFEYRHAKKGEVTFDSGTWIVYPYSPGSPFCYTVATPVARKPARVKVKAWHYDNDVVFKTPVLIDGYYIFISPAHQFGLSPLPKGAIEVIEVEVDAVAPELEAKP